MPALAGIVTIHERTISRIMPRLRAERPLASPATRTVLEMSISSLTRKGLPASGSHFQQRLAYFPEKSLGKLKIWETQE